jgi:cholesterol oxidase
VTDAATTTPSTLQFTEEMKGFITTGSDDYQDGYTRGKDEGTAFMFRLTIAIDDVDRFVAEPQHQGSASGYIDAEALGGRLPVEKGWFNLFVDAAEGNRKFMHYRLWFADGVGAKHTMVGFKDVHDDAGFDVWEDTTTLFIRVLGGHVPPDGEDDDIAAAGILKIHPVDFAQQLTTFRVSGPSLGARAGALTAFNKLFLGKLWETYAKLVPDPADGDQGAAQD